MWVHMHPVHTSVHPLNYRVHQVLAVNSLYVDFSCVVFTTANTITMSHSIVMHALSTSDILVVVQLASKVLLALCSHLCMPSLSNF